MNKSILIVDDDKTVLDSMREILTRSEYTCFEAVDGDSMDRILSREHPDLILLDVKLPGRSGLELLPEIKKLNPDTPVIIITGNAEINDAVKAIKTGAFDYLKKPFKSKELLINIEKALSWSNLLFRNRNLQEQLEKEFSFQGIIGKSKSIRDLIKTIKQIAQTDSNVFITGESGTGKDLVAKAIHFTGNRKSNPYIPINCSSLPETLLESELFGFTKGAFTGAYTNKIGLFKAADLGTIFLDEIGDMPVTLQAKMLRVLETQEFTPLGSTTVMKTNVRIISATNANLSEKINSNLFREDLYYRLNVVNIHIPPLRERREDILLLSDYFLKKYSSKMNKEIKGFHEGALDMIMRYNWPGNVRELENAVESSCALATESHIELKNLPEYMFGKRITQGRSELMPINRSLKETMDHYEKEYITELLKFCNGNVTKASEIAQIARQNFHAKMKGFEINVNDFRK
ncbi:MAG: sigma-54 dependent transcriptional regulator [bacterium]|nr:sigma-54 dependent transcriptional regulator [bacterium]